MTHESPKTDSEVKRVIGRANISENYEPVAGDCISIANAIHSIFGGNIIAISSRPHKTVIEHAAVEINDRIYDGRGVVTKELLYSEFSKSNTTIMDTHFWYPDAVETRRFRGATFDAVKDDLKESRDDFWANR